MGRPINGLYTLINRMIGEQLSEVKPFRAIVTDVSGNMIQFREVGAITANNGYYPRLDTGQSITTSDEVQVVGHKNPIVMGKVLR